MISPMEKAAILVEALPYIKKFNGKTVVIKYGGHALVDDNLKEAVMQDVVLMKLVGINPVLVHGGGPEISAMLNKLNVTSTFVQGLRVTDEVTMEVVEMVLAGKINKEIVGLIQQLGGKAVGLSGKDGGLMKTEKQWITGQNGDGTYSTLDIGFVGEVKSVNPDILQVVMAKGYIPV
ncbi:MAG: acetylglutamate kinase, partial [bacterium]|nr:acetylglutamate kinase [bacterium]